MNIKPFFQQVLSVVGETQDGGKISVKDEYGRFLLELIKNNTETTGTSVEVDTEELSSNLSYAIHEFTKALQAVNKFNHQLS